MAVYFLVMGVVFPDALSFTEKRETAPFFVTSQEKKSISSNESFDFIIDTGITGGDSDMLILIIGFPDAKSFDGIKIKSSEFTQSPKFFEVGDEIKTYYPSDYKIAEYPLLHIFNMPNPINKKPILQLEITPENLHKKKPGEALKLAVKRMLPGGPLAKKQLTKLKMYSGDQHPHSAQNFIVIELAKLNNKNLLRN